MPATTSTASGYWLASIKRQGTVAFGPSPYSVFRNVKDFGAKGKPQSPLICCESGQGYVTDLPNMRRR